MSTDLVDLLEDVEHVMLAFDGPVCSAFGGDPTPGATSVLTAARRSERELSIVSDISREAVEAYLADRGLLEHFEAVEGRAGSNVEQAPPGPHLLIKALSAYASRHGSTLEQARRASVFVGGSMTDVQAAGAAGVLCIAYANEPSERRRFEEESDAAAVISTMDELAEALNARWDAQWCARQGCC